MLGTVFMDNALSTLMSMSILIGGFVLLFFAYRSNSDGKALIKKSIEKRNLFAEIILLLMAIIEGVNAATYAVKEGRDFGASIAMHVFGGVMSGIFAFGIYKQVMDVAVAIKTNKHPIIIAKELIDVLGTVVLAVIFPIVNTYFVAIAAKHPHDFWHTLLFDWGRIQSGSVYYSTVVGMAHVFACFLLSLNSFDTTLFETKITDPGGVTDPLAQASDDDSEDADIDDDSDNNDSGLITTLPVPVSFDPEKVDVENYLVENFQVDRQRLHHRLAVNPTFKKDIGNLVTEALTFREEWDNAKAGISEATRKIEVNEKRMKTIETNTYGFDKDNPGRVFSHLAQETKDLKELNKHVQKECDMAEKNYNAVLDEINSELAVV